MTKQSEERRFGNRMDAANDKQTLVDLAEGATRVLDLGAGTGKLARDIADKWGCHVDAVDLSFKDDCKNTELVNYYKEDIVHFMQDRSLKIIRSAAECHDCMCYDCIILSAILHELTDSYINEICSNLRGLMKENCRVIIREPFYDNWLGPISLYGDELSDLVLDKISAKKYNEFVKTKKKHSNRSLLAENKNMDIQDIDILNLCFTLSYGEESWKREKHELRYARSLDWCKEQFNKYYPYTGFKVIPVLDTSYRDLFIKAGLPGEAFDLIKYTGMLVIIDY